MWQIQVIVCWSMLVARGCFFFMSVADEEDRDSSFGGVSAGVL